MRKNDNDNDMFANAACGVLADQCLRAMVRAIDKGGAKSEPALAL